MEMMKYLLSLMLFNDANSTLHAVYLVSFPSLLAPAALLRCKHALGGGYMGTLSTKPIHSNDASS